MKNIRKYVNLIIGCVLEAIGVVFFFEPNNLAATDVSGLAVILKKLFNISIPLFVLIGNILLIVICYIFLGKKKTIKTILGSLLLPLFIYLLQPLTSFVDISSVDIIALAAVGGIISGAGYGLIFKSGYTSGGTDIIEDILCYYFKIPLGTSVILVDGFVVLLGGIVFGFEPMIYSLIALILMSIFSDRKAIGISEDKILMINTQNKENLINYITDNYHYGVTIMDSKGGYTKKDNDFILCSVSSKNYFKIKKNLESIDSSAFIIVLNSYETKYAHKDERKNKKKKS